MASCCTRKIKAKKEKKEKERAAQELRVKIATAQKNATPEGKEWVVYGRRDPASDKNIARTASITSNDGLCYLTVQKRINGGELTGLDCPGIKISEYDDIYVKFDTSETSRKMELKSYSDSDDVYIPSSQFEYSGNMSYQDFTNGLVTAGAVAIKIPAADSFWVRFSLKGSTAAINQLGKKIPNANRVRAGL
ncbi:MAG: hypothetical protein N0E48_03550 [Candidatus Thiodiazotropha endolucinida]|nr:hypothetical protein [Candidatus Thiodiazotropha taylori]MCW4342435.1 hypothetical protein [Candidatus Thiodiazotropha endolucinida]